MEYSIAKGLVAAAHAAPLARAVLASAAPGTAFFLQKPFAESVCRNRAAVLQTNMSYSELYVLVMLPRLRIAI